MKPSTSGAETVDTLDRQVFEFWIVRDSCFEFELRRKQTWRTSEEDLHPTNQAANLRGREGESRQPPERAINHVLTSLDNPSLSNLDH